VIAMTAVIIWIRIARVVTAVPAVPAVTAVTRRACVMRTGGHGPPLAL
jgi:predicted tellurium resistance membrane protein TerC